MKFITDKNINMNKNRVILHSDHSYGSSYEDTEIWHFQVSFTEWADVILNFNKSTHQCVSCEGYLSEKSKRISIECIDIPDFVEAALLFESNEIPDYGTEILLENQIIHFDKEKNTLAFGDVQSQAEVVKFGEGQFVKLRDKKIIAIYIVFHSNDVTS